MRSKENYSNPLTRLLKRMQQTAGRSYGQIFLAIAFIATLCLLGNFSRSYLAPDRADNYHVKVLNAAHTDAFLGKLSKDSFSYLAMIDAGSSGCRAHVYRYGKLGEITGPLYIIPQHDSKKVKPGLSSFAKKPTEAGASLQGLVDFIKTQVPEEQWEYTPIWLKATAGLRLVEKSEADAVLGSVREFLVDKKNSPFLFRHAWARIISGNEEGGFGWIAFNYLKKVIGPKKIAGLVPYAVVEMGGASSQVSQIAPTKRDADAIPEEYRFSFEIEGEEFHLYTHSYLGFGAERARESLNTNIVTAAAGAKDISDPCLNPGFSRISTQERKEVYEGPGGEVSIKGSSNTQGACSAALLPLFTTGKTCATATLLPHSFNCVYQPAFLPESKNFLVFENFFYTSSALSVLPVSTLTVGNTSNSMFPLLTSPKNFLAAATVVCNTEWAAAQVTYPKDSQPKDTTLKLCFSSSYAAAFLTKGLGLDENKVVTVQKDVEGSEIEWALGAAYKEAADFLKRSNLRPQG